MAQLANTRSLSEIIKTSQQRAISTGLLTFGLLTVLLWGSFRPTVITIIETNRKYENQKVALQKFQLQNTNITSLVTKSLELKDDLAGLDYYFPNDGDYSLFITNLNQIAKNYDLRLESVSFSSTYFRQVEKVTSLQFDALTPVTFQTLIVGDSTKISQFLSYIENTPFLPKVIGISYSPNRTNIEKTNISITFLVYKMSLQAAK
jgi:Tfp pilus assembly protein PilO